MKSKAWTEKFMQGVFFIAACASVLAVALICVFLFANGIPAMKEIGFGKFLSGELWKPKNEIFGILPMIVGSLYITAGSILFGVPIGILTAVFMAFYCPKHIYKPLKTATELLAGIPSAARPAAAGTGDAVAGGNGIFLQLFCTAFYRPKRRQRRAAGLGVSDRLSQRTPLSAAGRSAV